MVVPSGRDTHFFNADLTVQVLDYFTLLFRQHRKYCVEELGLNLEDLLGGLMWDDFSGHKQKILKILRSCWAQGARVGIVRKYTWLT